MPPAERVREEGEREWRKKPVTIRALRWNGDNLREVIAFTGRHPSAADWSWEHFERVVARDGLIIFTLEGKHLANVGDYIIRGVKGEFYPCKPDIFALTYEPADDESRALAARPEGRETALGAKMYREECDRMQAFVREFNIGGAEGYGESVFELVRKEILVLRALSPAATGGSEVSEEMATAAMREDCSHRGESFDALWESLSVAERIEAIADWTAILEAALAARGADATGDK